MSAEYLVHQCRISVADDEYNVEVFSRQDGTHIAKTVFAPGDVIINDGASLEEVLEKHSRLLPLAIDSRLMLQEYRRRYGLN